MSWLGRLFGSAPPPPAPNSVTIPEDIVGELGGDLPLQVTVEEALRMLIEVRKRAAEHELEGVPFWLKREAGQSPEIDESLRDRVTQRRAAESEN